MHIFIKSVLLFYNRIIHGRFFVQFKTDMLLTKYTWCYSTCFWCYTASSLQNSSSIRHDQNNKINVTTEESVTDTFHLSQIKAYISYLVIDSIISYHIECWRRVDWRRHTPCGDLTRKINYSIYPLYLQRSLLLPRQTFVLTSGSLRLAIVLIYF